MSKLYSAAALAAAFAPRDILTNSEGRSLPDAQDFYSQLVWCTKPPSTPPTNNELLGALAQKLVGQGVWTPKGTVKWELGKRDPTWFYATLNGGFPLGEGDFLRLYLSLRRSKYPVYMEHTVVALAEAGVRAKTKVSLDQGRWHTYDGATLYLPPECLVAALTVLWRLHDRVFVQPTGFKPACQLTWQGRQLPVYLAQEPDVPDESFHGRLSAVLARATQLAVQEGILRAFPMVTRGRYSGWQLRAIEAERWASTVRVELGAAGVDPRWIYLNRAASPANTRIRRTLAALFGRLP